MLEKASYSQKLRLWAEAYFRALPWEIDRMTDELLAEAGYSPEEMTKIYEEIRNG